MKPNKWDKSTIHKGTSNSQIQESHRTLTTPLSPPMECCTKDQIQKDRGGDDKKVVKDRTMVKEGEVMLEERAKQTIRCHRSANNGLQLESSKNNKPRKPPKQVKAEESMLGAIKQKQKSQQ